MGVAVGVGVSVGVAVGVGVFVGVGLGVIVSVGVCVGVPDGIAVAVAVGAMGAEVTSGRDVAIGASDWQDASTTLRVAIASLANIRIVVVFDRFIFGL